MPQSSIDEFATRYLGKALHALEPGAKNVLARLNANRPVSRDASDEADEQAGFDERLADKVAAVGGSWGFIISFAIILIGWMLLNTDVLAHWHMAFDPYPYIFLNLMLSMLAAIQAPIIMMSQNRQATKDRVSARLDYEVNLRAELEIARLHERIETVVVDRLNSILEGQNDLVATLGRSRDAP